MENSQSEAEKSIVTDVSLSFWPFPPKKVLITGRQSASLAACFVKMLPLTQVNLVMTGSLQDADLNFNYLLDRINVISEWQEVYDSDYPIILAVNQLLHLNTGDQFLFLSTVFRYLEVNGRVLVLERVTGDSNIQFNHLLNLCNSIGFFDVTISPMESASWISILFRREQDFLHCRKPAINLG